MRYAHKVWKQWNEFQPLLKFYDTQPHRLCCQEGHNLDEELTAGCNCLSNWSHGGP